MVREGEEGAVGEGAAGGRVWLRVILNIPSRIWNAATVAMPDFL